jgi:SHS2 domain-containing protein
MPYRYLEDVAIADIAFEARAETLEDLFSLCADATLGVMVESPESVEGLVKKPVSAEEEELDMLLFRLLEEIVYYKDAEQLLLRCPWPRLTREGRRWRLSAELEGERINPSRHTLQLDVKAVTLHLLKVRQAAGGWMARVVLDI